MTDAPRQTKVLVALAGTNKIVIVDAIEYEDALWLVPQWLEAPAEGWKTPMRIVRLDGALDKLAPEYPAEFLVRAPLPTELLDLKTPPIQAGQYTVVDSPDNIRVPLPNRSLS